MRKLLLLLVSLLISTNALSAAETTGNTRPESIPELRAAIETILKDTRTPGAAIAIIYTNKAGWVAGIGKADVAANRPVTTNTLFRLGSISKTFAAVATLQLRDAGKLKLSDPVRQWVPDVTFVNPWESTDPLRIVHLLEQTTGFDDTHLREFAQDDPIPMSLQEALAKDVACRVCRWPPGTRMSYCNSVPAVLAAIIEKASGERFEDYVREHIFGPLHMDNAGYLDTPAAARQLTQLYHRDGITPYPYWHFLLRPSAAANASAADMANYVRFYLQRGRFDGTQVLQAASIERMETAKTMPSAKLGRMRNCGCANYPTPEGPFVFRGHNGAVPGGLAQMAYLPDQGRGYAFMINSGSFEASDRIGKLVRQYLTNNLVAPALPPVVPVPARIRRHYQGYYQFISPTEQWSYGFMRLIAVRKLTFNTNGLSTSVYGFRNDHWVPMSNRLFRHKDESIAMVALLPDSDGKTLIQYSFGTFKKIPALEVWSQLIGAGLVTVLVLSSLLLAPIWICRKLFGKNYQPGPLSVRVWPLAGAALLVAFDLLLVWAFRGIITSSYFDDVSLGTVNFLTASIMLTSLAFPLAAVIGLYVAWRERQAPMKRWAYWHSVLVGLAMVAVAVYYAYWGLLGLRLWE